MNASGGNNTAPFPILPGARSGSFFPSVLDYNVRRDFSPPRIAPEEQQRIEEQREMQQLIDAEPEKGHPDCYEIVVRTPSGKRLTRRFLNTEEVTFLFDWIDVVAAEDDFAKKDYLLV